MLARQIGCRAAGHARAISPGPNLPCCSSPATASCRLYTFIAVPAPSSQMEVFLRHLLREQVKTCAEALKKSQQQAMQKAAQALMLDKHKPGMRGLAELALKKPAAS